MRVAYAVHLRHTDVHEHHLGLQQTSVLNGLSAVFALRDGLHILVILEDTSNPFPYEGLIIHE